jgi:hypothetical protein
MLEAATRYEALTKFAGAIDAASRGRQIAHTVPAFLGLAKALRDR